MRDEKLSHEDFKKIKARVEQIKQDQDKVKTMNEELADIYWISETGIGAANSNSSIRYNNEAYGSDDVRVTASTSGRDRVAGVHRMMSTTRPQFKVTCKNKEYADKIEKFLDKVWDGSNGRLKAPLEKDLALSGILFTDENLNVTVVQDLIDNEENLIIKRRLESIRKETPYLLTVGSPMVTYPVWGEYGKSEHLEIKSFKGRQLKERYGISDASVKDDQKYDLWDYWDIENRCVAWGNSGTIGSNQIMGGKHDLPDIPRFTAMADGTELFFEEERQRNPFLYGYWKSQLHKREDEMLTVTYTSALARGSGPLVIIDKSDAQYDEEGNLDIEVNYAGLVRYFAASGKPQLADDKAFDNNLLNLLAITKDRGEQTTIPSQTLGENIQSGTPYSGYALASQNGRIPIIPIQEATEKVIKDTAEYLLLAIREGIVAVDEEMDGIKEGDILPDVKVEVSMEVDLPQDALRNAQTLAQLKNAGVPLSNEWMHTMLQVKDSSKMTMDVMSETAQQASFQQNLQKRVQEMSMLFERLAQGPPAPPEGGPQGEVPPGYHQMPDGSVMADSEMPTGEYPSIPGGPQAAQAGGEVMPATEPQNPNAQRGRA